MKKFFYCKVLGIHKWKGAIKPGIKVEPHHLETFEAFERISFVYCERCGKGSKFNKYE